MQLDQAERGFLVPQRRPARHAHGRGGPSAADLVNAASERDLAQIIATLGEERFARNVARAIVKARAEQPIATTRQLAEIVERSCAPAGEIHPATRTFQALRMFVNDELGELATALAASERMLKTGGRLAVISFHSLEDRVVKTFPHRARPRRCRLAPSARTAARAAELQPADAQAVVADDEELAANPRARSAKLRAAERTDAAPIGGDLEHLLPRLPSLADAMRARAPRGTR
jgi:16S rRNA (cytosine1402-N4)-methyltransferase